MDTRSNSVNILLLFAITAFCCSTCRESRAEEFFKEGHYSVDTRAGYHYASVTGDRGKVGEYESLDSGMEGGFTLHSYSKRNFLDLEGAIQDENDQNYLIDFDASRIFETETTYSRFKHHLDHDPLTNQDFFTDFGPDSTNAIIIEEMRSENTVRVPFIPNLKLNADFREFNRRGHEQATTVSKCTECHVTSKDKRVNQTTTDVDIGAAMTIRFLTFNYSHIQRSFNEGGTPPVAYYGFSSPSFPVKGFQYYSSVPDLRTSSNRFGTKAELPLHSSFSLDYEAGSNHNRETRYKRDYDSFAARFSTMVLRYASFTFNYHDYNMDTTVPGAMERDFTRSSVSFKTMPWKKSFLTGSYRWEDIDRKESAEESTGREVVSLSLVSRLYRTVDLNMRYRNERTHDPFVNEQWNLFRSLSTSEPTRSDEARIALNWSPKGNLSFSSYIVYQQADSSRYELDEERTEMMVSIWYAPRENLMITGSYGLIETEIDAQTAYKTVHGVRLADITSDNHVPYDDRSNCYNLLISYRFRPDLALSSNLTFIDSRSDFDSSLYDNNVGEYSDLSIERLDASFGLDYLYKPSISFYAKYNLRDYNDRETNDLDGDLHFISVGASYSF